METQYVNKAQLELNRVVELFSKKELPTLIKKVYFAENHKPSTIVELRQ